MSDDWKGHLEVFGKLPGAIVLHRAAPDSREVRSTVTSAFPFLTRLPEYLDFMAQIDLAGINLDEDMDQESADYYSFAFLPLEELVQRTDWRDDGFFRIADSLERLGPGEQGLANYEFAVATHGQDRLIYSQTVGAVRFAVECEGFANLVRLAVARKGRFLREK